MNTGEVLIDLLDDNWRRLNRAFNDLDTACLYWQPDPGGNSIGVTIWHMGRLFDHFFHTQALGKAVNEQCWFQNSWARRTGYDPRGLGRDGWGTLNGYTQEEVRAMPEFSQEELFGYLEQVYTTVKNYLGKTAETELFIAGAGFAEKYTRYQCIQMALLDNIRHLGEIFSLKAMWERRQHEPTLQN